MTDSESSELAVIKQIVSDLKYQLVGNGQPGIIQKHEWRMEKSENRISKLENWRWWVVGIAFGVALVIGAVGQHFIFEAATR